MKSFIGFIALLNVLALSSCGADKETTELPEVTPVVNESEEVSTEEGMIEEAAVNVESEKTIDPATLEEATASEETTIVQTSENTPVESVESVEPTEVIVETEASTEVENTITPEETGELVDEFMDDIDKIFGDLGAE